MTKLRMLFLLLALTTVGVAHIEAADAQMMVISGARGVVPANGGGGEDDGLGNFWFDANGGTCTRQSPAGAYVDAQACSTLAAAYEAASCGDVIRVAFADYSTGADQDQQILEDASASACTYNGLTMVGTPITIRAEANTRPKFRLIRLGVDLGSCGSNSPDKIVLIGLDVVWGVDIEHDVQDFVIEDFDGGSFATGGGYPGCGSDGGPTRGRIRSSDWGPCQTAGGTGVDCRQQFTEAPQEGKNKIVDGVSDVIFEDNVIHDFEITDGAHFECIWSNGGNNITIRRNRFYNCITNGIALNSQDMTGTWLFENNWWGANGTDNANLKWGLNGSCPSGTVIIRYNSFAASTSAGNEDSNLTCSNIWYIGNIFGEEYSCESGAQYFYNLYLGGAMCGTGGNGNATIGALPYVNTNSLASGNYHLSGAAGSTTADNYVPSSVTNSGATEDFDGDARSAPYDAGADER